jgi:transcriptional regulator with XRE-family HTH domain
MEEGTMRGLVAAEAVIASLPKDRQRAIEARGAALLEKIERRMSLAELRKGRKISQAKMAEALGIGQMQISRLEQRKDPRLSTLQRTVAAMGGHLTMIATFPDQEPVILIPPTASEQGNPRKAKPGKRPERPERKLSART